MKVAHDWLVTYAGAERVLEQLIELYPEADLFSVVDFLPVSKKLPCIEDLLTGSGLPP